MISLDHYYAQTLIKMLKQGPAKSQFFLCHQNRPWSITTSEESVSGSACKHSLVYRYFTEKRLSSMDIFFASLWETKEHTEKENSTLFMSHLLLAAKQGHLCIKIKEETLSPSVKDLWENEETSPLTDQEVKELTQKILQGSTILSEKLDPFIVRHPPYFYLKKYWKMEQECLIFLKKEEKNSLFSPEQEEELKNDLNQKENEGILLKEQSRAIFKASQSRLMLIAGGPGTGKTHTAGELIKAFWKLLRKSSESSFSIMLAAPTGKAASNLQKSLERAMSSTEDFPPLQAKTLHALLEIKRHSFHTTPSFLEADLLIVDESSMIDAKMMAALLKSLKPEARLILLGDPFQLPSVEAGSLFADFLQLDHPTIGKEELQQCLRAEIQPLITFASKIKTGRGEEVLNYLKKSADSSLFFFECPENVRDFYKLLWDSISPFILEASQEKNTPEEHLRMGQKFRLLSPLRQGPFGVAGVNAMIEKQVRQKLQLQKWLPIPIMISTNHYKEDLFNGETGILMKENTPGSLGDKDYAIFPSRSNASPPRIVPAVRLPSYEIAYCLSVHKSQGSEFEYVVVLLPEGSQKLGREVLYTGVTRARKRVDVWGTESTLLDTIKKKGFRLSGFQK